MPAYPRATPVGACLTARDVPAAVTFPVVGMVGGGQLARMTHQAGIPLGIRFAARPTPRRTPRPRSSPTSPVGDYRDLDTLRAFAAGCDVITFDHEHVPTEHLRALEADGVAVRPGPDALVHAQDKGVMRARLDRDRRAVPAWTASSPTRPTSTALRRRGTAGRSCSRRVRGGYDGKGVLGRRRRRGRRPPTPFGAAGRCRGAAPRRRSTSSASWPCIVVRSPHGQAVAYPVVETVQVDGICAVIAPAPGLDREPRGPRPSGSR